MPVSALKVVYRADTGFKNLLEDGHVAAGKVSCCPIPIGFIHTLKVRRSALIQLTQGIGDYIHMAVGIDSAGNSDAHQVDFRIVDDSLFILIRECRGP